MNTQRSCCQGKGFLCKWFLLLHIITKLILMKLRISHQKWPTIQGLHDFKGHITHSANWDHDYDYSGKRIAVIGNGSSGIQIVPQLQKLPGTDVMNFIRGPTWIYYRVPPSRHLGRKTDDPNPAYTEEEKKRWREDPEELKKYRKGMIHRTNKAFRQVSPDHKKSSLQSS